MTTTTLSPQPALATLSTQSLLNDVAALEGLSYDLLQKYNVQGPRYTSYPTAPLFTEAFAAPQMADALRVTNALGAPERTRPLSLYTHIPFCEAQCTFCGCNTVITKKTELAQPYLDILFREMDLWQHTMGKAIAERPVQQIHWGGGTPTYLTPEQLVSLFERQAKTFTLAPDAEIGIEVDPRVTHAEHLHALREVGFNRVSMGVQDFQPETQAAVNRIQSVEQTETLANLSRTLGFASVNMDLIYGLPYQTVESFSQTLDTIIRLNPDRIALYNFAYVPWMSGHQKTLDPATLPSGETKFAIFTLGIKRLVAAGYVYIGMDHFAKPTDDLTRALVDGSLSRNFMGYTTLAGPTVADTHAGCELYGLGISAISGLDGYYAQNQKKLSTYYAAIEAGTLATFRGIALTPEDKRRRQIILDILCTGELNWSRIDALYPNGNSQADFADVIVTLAPMQDDQLLTLHANGLSLTPLGRIFSRNVAMAFDAYLAAQRAAAADKPLFSRTL